MSIKDAVNGFVLGLRKGPVISQSNIIQATPGLGQVSVANTLELPTSQNVPTRWAHTFLGPGQPFAGQIDQSTRSIDAEKEPRSMQYIANINSTITPRISWGLTAFSDLRYFAENVPEVSGVIRLLTEEMKAFIPAIVDEDDNDVEVPELKWMLESPDRVNPWPVWLSRFLYNVLVYDAPAIYKMRASNYFSRSTNVGDLRKNTVPQVELVNEGVRVDGEVTATAYLRWKCPRCAGSNIRLLDKESSAEEPACLHCGYAADEETLKLLKGDAFASPVIPAVSPIIGMRIIDGSTLFALIDERGEQPVPPAPAFTQVIWGVPRMFLNRNQIWYRPRFLRADAPYGRSFIEDASPAVKLLDKLWPYEGAKYESGNLPDMGLTCPEGWTSADQVLDYEDAFNSRQAGATTERAGRVRFFPHGMEPLITKDLTFNKESYDAATNTIRMAAGIPKSEAGEAPEGMMGGKSFAEAMQSSFYRMGIAPLQTFIEGLFTDIIKENGYTGIKYKLRFPNESMDPEKEEGKWSNRFQIGGITRDEYRAGIGLEPLGGEEGAFIVTPGQTAQEDDGSGMIPVGGKNGRIPVTNNNGRVNVLRNPVGVLRNPIAVSKSLSALRPDWADPGEFRAGMREEMEHADVTGGDDAAIAAIVLAHLRERPDYYSRLAEAMEKEGEAAPAGINAQNAPNGVYLAGDEDAIVGSDAEESETESDELAKFANILRKHCGVCAEDDQYYETPVTQPVEADMPHQGANDSQIVSIGGGDLEPRPAVFKPKSGEKPSLVEWAGGDLYRRAEACYLLDRELARDPNHYLVPVTWYTDVDGEIGSIQHYVKGGDRKDPNQYAYEFVEQAAVFDYITGQMDRASRNYLTHPDDEFRPVLIDNDLSFSPKEDIDIRSAFVTAMRGKNISSDMHEQIYLLDGNTALWQDVMDCLEDEDAVANARKRAHELLETGVIPDVTTPDMPEAAVTSDPATTATSDELNKADEWDETKHPRGEGGKFSSGPGGEGGDHEPIGEGWKKGDPVQTKAGHFVSEHTKENGNRSTTVKHNSRGEGGYLVTRQQVDGKKKFQDNTPFRTKEEAYAFAEKYLDEAKKPEDKPKPAPKPEPKPEEQKPESVPAQPKPAEAAPKEPELTHEQHIKHAQDDIQSENQRTDVAYDPKKDMGRISYYKTMEAVTIRGDYNPAFVEAIKQIPGRGWDNLNKQWIIPVPMYDRAKQVFNRFYNNSLNQTVSETANKVRNEQRVKEQQAYEEKANKIPASQKQLDYIDDLSERYVQANGKPIDSKFFGEHLTQKRASELIDGLKSHEEDLSYMGIFRR